MIPIAELVSLAKLDTVAGEPPWFFRLPLYVEQSTAELNAKQYITPLWHPVLSSLTRSHVETRQEIHF